MLFAVIVNYRTPQLTLECLESLVAELRILGGRVIVTDNASGDDSVDRLQTAVQQRHWEDCVQVMPLERNGGFAYGNNQAIAAALAQEPRAEFFWLLNPDTVIRPGALQALVAFLQAHPRVGIVGSRLENADGTPQHSAFRFPSIQGELETAARLRIVQKLVPRKIIAMPVAEVPCRAEWVAGASLLVRREVFAEVGLLDERFFLYFEEVDFCKRAAQLGWECWCEPASRVVHLAGQATGVTDRSKRLRRPTYWFDSRRWYFLKHHGAAYTAIADLVWATAYAAWRCRRVVQRKVDTDPPRLLFDFLRHSVLARLSNVAPSPGQVST